MCIRDSCAGGRYDGLVEYFGGPATAGFGFGIGVEPVSYTHLDVYKRQMLKASLTFVGEACL